MKLPGSKFNLSNSSGYTLITVVFVVVILIILASIGLGVATTEIKLTKNQQGSVEALYVAESGVNRALFYLGDTWKSDFENGTGSWPRSVPSVTLPNGQTNDIQVERSVSPTNSNLIIAKVTSTGTSRGAKGTAQRKIQVVAQELIGGGGGGVTGDFAVYANNDFIFNNSNTFTLNDGPLWTDKKFISKGSTRLMGNGTTAYYVGGKDIDLTPMGLSIVPAGAPAKNFNGPDVNSFRNWIYNNTLDAKQVSTPPSLLNKSSYSCVYNGSLPVPPSSGCSVLVRNIVGDTLVVSGSSGTNLTIDGNLYVEGNLKLSGFSNVTIKGSVVTEGGLIVDGVGNFYAYGVYLLGQKDMPPYQKGSMVILNNTRVYIKDASGSRGEVYMKGILIYAGASILEAGNIQMDGTNPIGGPAFTVNGTTNIVLGTVLVPNGDIVIVGGSNAVVGDIYSGRNITTSGYNTVNLKGIVFAEKDFTYTGTSDLRTDSGVNIFAGEDLVLNGSTNTTIKGLLVGGKSVSITGGTSTIIESPGGLPSGIISGGELTATGYNTINITGLIWSEKKMIFGGGGDTTITGGIISHHDIEFMGGGSLTVNYVKNFIDITLSPGGSGGGGTPLKVVDWREK